MGFKINLKVSLIFLFLAIISVEIFVVVFRDEILGGGQSDTIQAKIKLGRERSADLIILGDSSASENIDPAIIEKKTNYSSLNLATVGDSLMIGNYFQLQDYLKYHQPPKAILLMFVYDFWHRRPNNLVYRNYYNFIIKEIIFNPDSLKVNSYFLAFLMPSFRYRLDILKIMNPASIINGGHLLSSFRSIKEERDWFRIRVYEKSGFLPVFRSFPEYYSLDVKWHQRFLSGSDFYVSKSNQYYLSKISSLAKENNIKVYYAAPVLSKDIVGYEPGQSYLNGCLSFINGLSEKYDFKIINEDYYSLDALAHSNSVDHLLAGEAEKFSSFLADRINKFK